MTDPLETLMAGSNALYQQFVEENLAADRALVGGQVSTYLSAQAKSAREAIGINDDGDPPAAG